MICGSLYTALRGSVRGSRLSAPTIRRHNSRSMRVLLGKLHKHERDFSFCLRLTSAERRIIPLRGNDGARKKPGDRMIAGPLLTCRGLHTVQSRRLHGFLAVQPSETVTLNTH